MAEDFLRIEESAHMNALDRASYDHSIFPL
jgi:hypothetical protein